MMAISNGSFDMILLSSLVGDRHEVRGSLWLCPGGESATVVELADDAVEQVEAAADVVPR